MRVYLKQIGLGKHSELKEYQGYRCLHLFMLVSSAIACYRRVLYAYKSYKHIYLLFIDDLTG